MTPLVAAEDALITFLQSLPQYGTVRSRIDFGRRFWFIDMPDEWQDATGTILTLLKDLHGSSSASPVGSGLTPPRRAAEGTGSAASTEGGRAGAPGAEVAAARSAATCPPKATGLAAATPTRSPKIASVDDDPFAAGLRKSAAKLMAALEGRNVSHGPLGFYGPLQNMHISIGGPDEVGRRVDLAVDRFASEEQGSIGFPSIQHDGVFHARRFLARVTIRGGTARKRHKNDRFHITLGYYGTRSLEDPAAGPGNRVCVNLGALKSGGKNPRRTRSATLDSES